MPSNNFKPIHRFFHGDPIEKRPGMYSTSIGDTWLYFSHNALVGVSHLEIDPDKKDVFYILNTADDNDKKAMREEIDAAKITEVDIDDLVGHALRLTAAEISSIVHQKLIPHQGE